MYWVRLVIATSLDGRLAFPNGGKSELGGKGDRKVLEESLAWSDATLIGSKTLTIHGSTCLIHNSKLINMRQEQGLSKQPITLVVSNQQNLSPKLKFFNQPIEKWLISKNTKKSIQGFHRTFKIEKTWEETLLNLSKEGLKKITLLGGIKLLNSLLLEDQIDELQITITPRIIGGEYTWVALNPNKIPSQLADIEAWKLEKIQDLGENEVMLRYLRNWS